MNVTALIPCAAVWGCAAVLAQTPQVSGVVNYATFQSQIAPGGLASIFGSGLGPAAGVAGSAAGLSVSFNGLPAYILDSSAGQDNVQIPYEVRPGSANVVVEYQGHSSAPFAVTVLAYAPGFFSIRAAGGNVGLFQHANGAVVGGQSPAQPGETLASSMTGLGQTAATRTIDLLLVVTSAVPPIQSPPASHWDVKPKASGSGCQASRLNLVFTTLGNGASTPAGWAQPVAVEASDDCGAAMTTGSVVVSFSNGDPPLALLGNGAGTWAGSWTPMSSAAGVTLTATASQPDVPLSGQAQITVGVPDNAGVPVLTPGGVLDAASFSLSATPASGQLVAIFGANLADQDASAPGLPLPDFIGDLQLVTADQAIPMYFATPGVAGAILPYGPTAGTSIEMVASRGTALSTPIQVPVSSGEPGIFTTSGTGQGQGHIYISGATLADASNPATINDLIVIYCGGLGEVSPGVQAGVSVPESYFYARNPVSLTIGGVDVPIIFAGLTPDSAGLYQINAILPTGYSH